MHEPPTRIYRPHPAPPVPDSADDAPVRIYPPPANQRAEGGSFCDYSFSRQSAQTPYSTVLDWSIRKP